ncbi:MAG: rubrerythrin family protein [Deltaproteobacteria bacterium]|nr:rubrerythrin family protein [Deltaproteobacteria bacterium]MBW1846982.1 rubrerythrin family protein [Deltaproteobacteria bacterium]MBW2182041.1 rubrerythrin family protein [Deltaproteobacteria bacterium]
MAFKWDNDMANAYVKSTVSAALNNLYSMRLKKDGKTGLAKLLEAIGFAEEINARRILMHLRGKIEDPEVYIQDLMRIKKESFSEDYPCISRALKQSGSETASEAFEQFGEVAKIHFDLIEKVKENEADAASFYHICAVCGYISETEAPEKCPVCGAVKSKFKTTE